MSKKSKEPEAKERASEIHRDAPVSREPVFEAPLKTDAPKGGRAVFVSGSKFSKPFMLQASQDFRAGKVKGAAQIRLPDGQTITAGPTYETRMSPELMQLIKAGVLQASTFGKSAKR